MRRRRCRREAQRHACANGGSIIRAKTIANRQRPHAHRTAEPHHPELRVDEQAMRLTTIKLSGFKSFVDPTVLHLPTNLTGIVGPNGCGKSNIIDAIRWVMGESAPTRLRGDSLTAVIFSG